MKINQNIKKCSKIFLQIYKKIFNIRIIKKLIYFKKKFSRHSLNIKLQLELKNKRQTVIFTQ